ncbi:MAG: STAS domain-containing protein [Roseiflexaceae bacterium]
MRVTRRLVGSAILTIQGLGSVALLLGQLNLVRDPVSGQLSLGSSPETVIAMIVAVVISFGLLWLYRRDWPYAGIINVVLITLLVGYGTPYENISATSAPIVAVPAAVALIFTRPIWVIGSMIGLMVIFSLRNGPENFYINSYIGDIRTLGTVVFLTAAMFFSRLIAEDAFNQRSYEAEQAKLARAEAERQAKAVAQQAQELQQQNQMQRQLLDLVDQLETPVVPLEAGVLLAPLIGSLDMRRLQTLTSRLLNQVVAQRADLVILDIAGVPDIDAPVADQLEQTAQSLRLVGCQVMMTGITADVAIALVERQIQLNGIQTFRAPQEALEIWRNRIPNTPTRE